MLQIDNPHAMFQELLTAAKTYVASSLVHPVLGSTIDAQKELERAAVAYTRAAHQTFGSMWVDLKKALGVMGGSTDHEHKNMLKAVETLKIERDEAVRKFEGAQAELTKALGNPIGFPYPLTWDDLLLKVSKLRDVDRDVYELRARLATIQADSNKELEKRREADRAVEAANGEIKARDLALEYACERARQYQTAAAETAKTSIKMVDKIQALEEENQRLRDRNETLSGYLQALGRTDRK